MTIQDAQSIIVHDIEVGAASPTSTALPAMPGSGQNTSV